MMRHAAVLLAGLLAATGAAAAHTGHAAEQPPETVGTTVTPDMAVYGLDVAADNAAVALGITARGAVAYERASEALVMQEENRTEARDRALQQLNAVAGNATRSDIDGLQKAEAVLQAVQDRAPDQAGISTALSAVRAAQERMPDDAGPNGIPV